MNTKPAPAPTMRSFLADLRKADPLFWLVALLIAASFLARYLIHST